MTRPAISAQCGQQTSRDGPATENARRQLKVLLHGVINQHDRAQRSRRMAAFLPAMVLPVSGNDYAR
jgi:hypothetical protein